MAETTKAAKPGAKEVVLTIDVGGSHVKVQTSAGSDIRRTDSGPELTPAQTVEKVKKLADGLDFDVISMGYPGPVRKNRPSLDPKNLGKGWEGFDFAAAFGKPFKMVNDALMQAIGSYDGGRMLFIGLGTGLGSAMIMEHVAQPMELAHLPYRKEMTFEDYIGERGLERRGKEKWRISVADVVERLAAALQPDYIVIGGGNVDKLKDLPPNCRRGDNKRAFEGGFRLWHNKALVI
jgi:polyphosphate glucokinase